MPVLSSSAPSVDLDQLTGAIPGFVSDGVTVDVWWPTPNVMVTRVLGHLDLPASRFLATALRVQLAKISALTIGFHEWSNVKDYDSEARILLTELTRDALPRSQGVHVLVGSPLVLFGLKAASSVLSKVYPHRSRVSFDAALAAALARTRPVNEESATSSGLRDAACSRCGTQRAGTDGTAYSLINEGWWLSRPTTGQAKPAWHCPDCWRQRMSR